MKRTWKKGLKKKLWLLAAAMTGCLSLLTACGSSAVTTETHAEAAVTGEMDGGMYTSGGGETAAVEMAADTMEAAREAGSEAPEVQAIDERKLIRNVNLSVETREFDTLFFQLEGQVKALGGYIEVLNNNQYSDGSGKGGFMTARIPAEKLDLFVTYVSENANVTSRDESVQDVTLQYVDMESHKKVLLAEQKSLLTLLEKAEKIEDIITLEERLSEVRYQIESMESQLRVLQNQVSYSTVYITIEEVKVINAAAEQTAWQRIATGFTNNVIRMKNALSELAIQFIVALPFLLTIVAVVLIFALLIRFLIKRHDKKAEEKKAAGKNEQNPGAQSGENEVQKHDPRI